MLDLNQLNCFVAVAEELHFGRAAARLFMTQPPLSRQIRLLEQTLGVKLFDRTSRTVHLTPAGKVFLGDATRLLHLAAQAATSAQRASKGATGRITIGFTSGAGLQLVPRLVAAAQHALPNIDVVLKEMVSVAQLEALAANTIDLAFVRPIPARQLLQNQTVEREPMMLALPREHPLVSYPLITLQDMDRLPFIMYSATQGKYFYNMITGLFGASGVTPDYIQHLDLTHTIVALVRTGLGVSIVPSSSRQLHFDDVVFRPLWRDDIFAQTNMTWRPDQHNPALTTFRQFASSYFANLGSSGIAPSDLPL
jgi:DNA-binding transcriptional LysR family regulator